MSAEEERIQALWESDRAELLLRLPFLGLLAMRLTVVIGRWQSIPTAATDGEHFFGNAEFLARLTREERLFVLAHEVWHCAALHPLRRQGREPRRWNVAVDHETNSVLAEAGLTPPAGAIHYPRWEGRAAETVYERLPTPPPDRGPWADPHEPAGRDWPGKPGSAKRRSVWQRWPGYVRGALQQTAHQPGRLPGSARRLLDELLRPWVDWREQLRRFLGQRLGEQRLWTTPDRRHLARGAWLPGRHRRARRVAVALDTSGSTRHAVQALMGELIGIVRAASADDRLRVLVFDAIVQSDETVRSGAPTQTLRRTRGGGGTDFRPVFQTLKGDPPDALVLLTDGAGPAPVSSPGYPVVWALCRSGQAPTAWGHALPLDDRTRTSAHSSAGRGA